MSHLAKLREGGDKWTFRIIFWFCYENIVQNKLTTKVIMHKEWVIVLLLLQNSTAMHNVWTLHVEETAPVFVFSECDKKTQVSNVVLY